MSVVHGSFYSFIAIHMHVYALVQLTAQRPQPLCHGQVAVGTRCAEGALAVHVYVNALVQRPQPLCHLQVSSRTRLPKCVFRKHVHINALGQ